MFEPLVMEWQPAVATWYVNAGCAFDAVESGPCRVGESLVCTSIEAVPLGPGRWELKATLARKDTAAGTLSKLINEIDAAADKARKAQGI